MAKPLVTWRGTVAAPWVDYNGHLRDAYYLLVFSFATDGLMDRIGLDAPGRALTGHTLYTLETHLNYLQEVREGVAIEVHTQALGADSKRLHLFHSMRRTDDATLLATNEQMLCNIDTAGPRSAPFAPSVALRLAPLVDAHRHWPRPPQAGRSIALPGANQHAGIR
jgi:acyl-CoA thioester hydrolase